MLDGMSKHTPFFAALFFALVCVGCDATYSAGPDEKKEPAKPAAKPRRVEAGKNVTLEIQGDQRRVLVQTEVCLVRGPLELLLCKQHTKEHESILHGDFDARDIHKALLAAGADTGSPVQYQPKFKPATGAKIKVSLQYEQKGKLVTVPAGRWIRNMKTGKELDVDWVFAGSHLVKNVLEPGKPDIYLANEGDVICVSNFEDAMLDLPIESSKDDADRAFEANTEKIPEEKTKVTVILEPVVKRKK
jgi:hypothetical protein